MANTSVLNILRTIKDRGSISRTDLQQVTGLSWGTITNTTRELLERNFIREEGATASKAGRKPMRLALNPARHSLIGVEITPELVRCLAMNLAGDTLWYETAPVSGSDEPEAILDHTADIVRRGLSAVSARLCLGIGVAVPGTLDVKTGAVVRAPRLPKWSNVPVRDRLQAKLNSAIRIERIANCLAIAERWFGAAGDAEEILCVKIGEGVGMGVLINGEIFRGGQGMAAEFGHITIDPDGPACACGDRGCVEAYCSAPAILHHARSLAAGPDAAATVKSVEELAALAGNNNAAALATFERMGKVLGIGVANAIDLFNPALVVLSGKSAAAEQFFMGALQKQVETHAWPHSSHKLLVSRLGERATAMGACGMILQAAFEHDAAARAESMTA
ncbi:MAG TPA: ROK family transcriptional regulator [Phycisphaerae bacterium]|nr:ROK family transcriptional regulator [Phycisphaerae bacterium]